MFLRPLVATATVFATLLLASCGGGGGSGASSAGPTPSTPPGPPAPTDIPATDAEAARFLIQATFGANKADIARVRQIGYGAWIDEQMDTARTPATLILPYIHQMTVANTLDYADRRNYWLWQAGSAKDQLRLRMGYALSQIFVVSDRDYNTANFERITDYQDMLDREAFGSYRNLIEKVTLHPAMGTYLSHLGNQKAVSYKNAQGLQINVVPDENYAREVMQLFSIGLVQRNPDFSRKLDGAGQPIPTYDQATISAMARVFTGWTWAGNQDNYFRWNGHDNDYKPMECYPKYHDDQAKTIFNGITIAATSDCKVTLAQTLDALSNHANVAPFISRQLIQRFVTSNPSPAYIGRVSKVWTDNGGNLGKVLKAILLDTEARTPPAATDSVFGKPREPLIKLTTLWRAFDATYSAKANGSYKFNFSYSWDLTQAISQDSLRSPSVFNFYDPDYSLPGVNGAPGPYAPEFQILNEATFAAAHNVNDSLTSRSITGTDAATTDMPMLQADSLMAKSQANDHAGMVDEINVLLFGGQLQTSSRQAMITMLDKLQTDKETPVMKVRSLLLLALASPEFAVQR